MIEQIFSVIKDAKLKAMLTSTLRDIPLEELKALCLEQLEGMSKKRIRYLIAGRNESHVRYTQFFIRDGLRGMIFGTSQIFTKSKGWRLVLNGKKEKINN